MVWNYRPTRHCRRTRRAIAARARLEAEHLPVYAPELNPVEGAWSPLKRTALATPTFTESADPGRGTSGTAPTS
ncbi:transposase [Nocardiopsis sp. CNT312]|uniref:transposase n=1 Tax=Nocardiopsis sp. CNT312 TaxID=1137268 RepID=UPI00350FDEC2